MSARSDIAKLLEQWLELTQAEGGAIQAAAWRLVGEIQARKAALRKTFDEAREQWGREKPGGAPANPFRAELGRLLSLEERNSTLLAAQLRRARAEQETLDQARRNLRKIQRSYSRKQLPTAWHTYS